MSEHRDKQLGRLKKLLALAGSQDNEHEAGVAFLSACAEIQRLQPIYVIPAQTAVKVARSEALDATAPLTVKSGTILRENQRVRSDLIRYGFLCFRLYDGFLFVQPDKVRLA